MRKIKLELKNLTNLIKFQKNKKKNMKSGKIEEIIFFFILIFFINLSALALDEISTVPLINLENLEPSYEDIDLDEKNESTNKTYEIKEKNKKKKISNQITVNILGLDKITAKTTEIKIKIGETRKFGLLQIKAIKCGKINSNNKVGEAAYIQVKDLSDNQDEKVFVFNGWTFSSSPSLRPIDHPVYDLWLVGCENV